MSCGVTGFVMVRPPARALGVARDEIPDPRIDHLAVFTAAEDAVVADALRAEVLLVALGNALAERLRGLGLAVAGDVVQLALDGEERRPLDELGAHALARDH